MSFNEADLHLQSVNDRLELLLTVLRYDSFCGRKYFSFYDRILINRHRSGLLSFIAYLFREIPHEDFKYVELPAELDNKIETINKEIISQNWSYRDEYMY